MPALGGKADIKHGYAECLLLTQSGHWNSKDNFGANIVINDLLSPLASLFVSKCCK
jgi:hypothetical protein